MKKNNSKLKTIDLFAGCGGLSLGFHNSNLYDIVAHVEWEKAPLETIRHWLKQQGVKDIEKKIVHFDIQRLEELFAGWKHDIRFPDGEGLDKIVSSIGKLDIIIGEGPSARAIKIDLPKFTLVGATTRLGAIANPLKDRFGIPLRINFYNVKELEQIIERDAKILNIGIENLASKEIAKRSRGTPRIAIRLLKRVRDFAINANQEIITQKIADYALTQLEIDNYGLDASDHRYLRFIAENYRGGPVGVETISSAISEERDTVEDSIEPYLIQQGFIEKTPRGRVITEKTWNIFKNL